MGFFKRKKKEPELCPNCGKPVTKGIVFCDSCGLRLSSPPACAKCQLPLAPGTNFCEACGTPVGSVPAHRKDILNPDKKSPDFKKKGRASKEKTPEQKTPLIPQGVKNTDAVTTITENTEQEEVPGDRAAIELPGPPEKNQISVPAKKNTPTVWPRFTMRTTLLSCVLLLCLILLGAFITGHVRIPPAKFLSGDTGMGVTDPAQSFPENGSAGTVILTIPPTIPAPVLSPGPTRVPPESLRVWFQAERDPITNIVTVFFEGGKGQSGIREVKVRLTRSDGAVIEQIFKPIAIGEGASLPGTKFSDRLEVIVFYNNDDQYTVIDKIFDYKGRN
jgi:hypothetical protein